MQIIIKSLAVLFTLLSIRSFAQTPVQKENEIADFKILTPEEVQKAAIEAQKKAEEEQKMLKIMEEKKVKEASKIRPSERDLYMKLKGNESTYPIANNYYRQYLKGRKNSKILISSGLILTIGGLTLPNILNKSLERNFNNYSNIQTYFDKFDRNTYLGIGMLVSGIGMTLISIPVSIKAKTNLKMAKNALVKIDTRINGATLAIKF